MPDYNNTIIYKICCKDVNVTEIYIGHTTNFKRRKWDHKYSCNNEKSRQYNSFVYQFIRMNGGFDNWEMIKLYNFPCDSRTEACLEERSCIDKFGSKLNKINPYTSEEERKQNEKEYRVNNVEKRIKYEKEYRNNNKEKILEKAKEHYHQNKEKINEKRKEYYEQTKEKRKEKVNCPNCNQLCCKWSLYNHMKTKTCKSFNQK